MAAQVVDVRCPNRTKKLFARMTVTDDPAVLFEVACRDCRNDARALGKDVRMVLHVFDGAGRCLDTLMVDTRR